jgi:hypothetical protein
MSFHHQDLRNRFVAYLAFSLLLACGGGGGGNQTPPVPTPPNVTVTVTPAAASVLPGQSQTFTATVTGDPNTAVQWSVLEGAGAGSIDANGKFTATTKLGVAHVQALSSANPSRGAQGVLTVSRFLPQGSAARAHGSGVVVSMLDGTILVAGEYSLSGKSAEIFDPAAGTFSPAGDMTTVRNFPTGTLLPDGTVLIAGGSGLKSAELYHPQTRTFTPLPDMAVARSSHEAVLLPTGKVLLMGEEFGAPECVVELYDPSNQKFVRTGDLKTPRLHARLLPLPDGRVLAIGGYGIDWPNPTYTSVEAYDPQTGTWTKIGDLSTYRLNFSASLLGDGRILIAGGVDSTWNGLSSSEIFNPATGTSTPSGTMAGTRDSHGAITLVDGTILLVSGGNTTSSGNSTSVMVLNTFEHYDPATGLFTAGDERIPDYLQSTQLRPKLLPDGTVWMLAGTFTFIYHPPVPSTPRIQLPLGPLRVPPKGSLLLAAAIEGLADPTVDWSVQEGASGGSVDAHGRYSAPSIPGNYHVVATSHATTSLTGTVTIQVQASGTTLAITPGSSYLMTNGSLTLVAKANGAATYEVSWEMTEGPAAGSVDSKGRFFAPATPGTYHVVATSLWDPSVQANATVVAEAGGALTALLLPKPLHNLEAVRLLDGRVLISGGATTPAGSGQDLAVADAYFFDPTTSAFTPAGTMTSTRQEHRGVLLPDGRVLISGGVLMLPYTQPLGTQEWFTPGTGFATTGNLANARTRHDLASLPDGTLFVFGNPYFSQPATELFDPASGTATGNPEPGNISVPLTGRAVSLEDGRVLVLAESNNGGTKASYLCDPVAKTWTALPDRGASRFGAEVVRLRDGRVLILGGAPNEPRAELFDPATSTFQWTGALFQNRDYCKANLLPNGTVLVTGGLQVYSGIAQCELYDPVSGLFSTAGTLPKARFKHAATVLPNSKVLILGGAEASGTDYGVTGIDSVVVYDIPAPAGVSVGILATRVHLKAGKAWPFLGTVSGSANWTLNWSVTETGGGSITAQGVYTAPMTPGTYQVVATSVADSSKCATATVVVE